MTRRSIVPWLTAVICVLTARAEVVLDGSLGASGALMGPGYAVGANLGRQVGSNLFHSFSAFNLYQGESATFSGPAAVQNIISRVTGGNASWIDGTLRSTIAGANFFLINPAGLMFGPHAALDLTGSFYASTADYLEMADGARFYADPGAASVLTVAAPAAFGFLDDDIAGIQLSGSGLTVNEAQTLGLAGGAITIEGGSLGAPAGRIWLESHATATAVDGPIGISGGHAMDVSGEGDGVVWIEGGSFVIADSSIAAHTSAGTGTGGVLVAVSGEFTADNSLIAADNQGAGQWGSNIQLSADTLTIDNDSWISADALSSGDGGVIQIETKRLRLDHGSLISSDAYDSGAGGYIALRADESVVVTSLTGSIQANTHGSGAGGNIRIETPSLTVDGGNILANTYGLGAGGYIGLTVDNLTVANQGYVSSETQGAGEGGFISVTASGAVTVSGENSRIFSNAHDAGNAGTISLTAATVAVEGGAIESETFGAGEGGYILIQAGESLEIKGLTGGIQANTHASGMGGYIRIETPSLTVDGGNIYAYTEGDGEGGYIDLTVGKLDVVNQGWISSESRGAGAGGLIDITASDAVTVSGENSRIFSNASGAGNAGLISLVADTVRVEDGAIEAETFGAGKGGFIWIQAGESVEIKGLNGGIQANAHASGMGGYILIETPSLTVDGGNIYAYTEGAGDAGHIGLTVDKLDVVNQGWISSATYGAGAGGGIYIAASGAVSVTGDDSRIFSDADDTGPAGWIVIEADSLRVSQGGRLSAGSTGGGTGGAIDVSATDAIEVSDGGAIATSTTQSDGGNIALRATSQLALFGGEITTSVAGGLGNGGNITIDPTFVILDDAARIIANAYGGNGGNIHISADHYLAAPGSVVSASSQLGIDGTVVIDSPAADLSGTVTILSADYLDTPDLVDDPCAARAAGAESSFVVTGRGGLPRAPGDWLPSP